MQAQNIIESSADRVDASSPASDGEHVKRGIESDTYVTAREPVGNGVAAEFLSNLAHQLRSPLSSLRVWVDLLSDPSAVANPAGMRRLVEGIDRATSRIERQLTDVLEAGYLEAGTLTVETEPVDAVEQLVLAVSDTDQIARSRRIGIDLNMSQQPAIVTAEKERLRQLISHFLSNAIKFSPVGSKVTVTTGTSPQITPGPLTTVILEPQIDGPAHYFCISNDGPAIDRELHHDLFKPFYRAAHSESHSGGGSGLGLAISHGLLRLMGGGIWLRSGVDRGVEFEISLPDAEQAAVIATGHGGDAA